MPKLDTTDPCVIRYLLENYERERDLRVKWAIKYADKFSKAATFRGEIKNYTQADIAKSNMIAGMAMVTRDHVVTARHRLKASVEDYRVPVKASEPKPVMAPVPSEVKELLKEGRKNYLIKRNQVRPENKYNFMETGNWAYGWRLEESEIKMHGPAHGRVLHLQNALHSRVGPQPDPEHYNSPDASRTFCARIMT